MCIVTGLNWRTMTAVCLSVCLCLCVLDAKQQRFAEQESGTWRRPVTRFNGPGVGRRQKAHHESPRKLVKLRNDNNESLAEHFICRPLF